MVYRVNVVTGDVEYVTASDQGSLQGNDGGCYDSTDYGDASPVMARLGTNIFDAATDGTADLFLEAVGIRVYGVDPLMRRGCP